MNVLSILCFVLVVTSGVLALARSSGVGSEAGAGTAGAVVLRDTRNATNAVLTSADRDWERAAKYALSIYPLAAGEPVGEVQKLRLDLSSGSVRIVNTGATVNAYLDLVPGALAASAKASAQAGAAVDSSLLQAGKADCRAPGAVQSAPLCALAAAEVNRLDTRTDLAKVNGAYGASPSSNLPGLVARWGGDKSGISAGLAWHLAGAAAYLTSPLNNDCAVFVLETDK